MSSFRKMSVETFETSRHGSRQSQSSDGYQSDGDASSGRLCRRQAHIDSSTDRVALGRKKDIVGLIESLPSLLVDAVKAVVADETRKITVVLRQHVDEVNIALEDKQRLASTYAHPNIMGRPTLQRSGSQASVRSVGRSSSKHSRYSRGNPNVESSDVWRSGLVQPPNTVSAPDGTPVRSDRDPAEFCPENSDISLALTSEHQRNVSLPVASRIVSTKSGMRDVARAQQENITSSIGHRRSADRPLQIIPDSSVGAPNRLRTVSVLQNLRVEELAQRIGCDEGQLQPSDYRTLSPFRFRLLGLLPWNGEGLRPRCSYSLLYVGFVITLALANFGMSVYTFSSMTRYRLVLDVNPMLFSGGSCLALFLIQRVSFEDVLGCSSALLARYAIEKRFIQEWTSRTKFEGIVATVIHLSVTTSILVPVLFHASGYGLDVTLLLQSVSFATSCGFILHTNSLIVHACVALELGVDAFGTHFTQTPNFGVAISDWNDLRAVSRKVSGSLSASFTVLLLVALSSLINCAVTGIMTSDHEVLNSLAANLAGSLLPACVLSLTFGYTLFKAAMFTAHCDEVPQIVNSWSLGEDLDEERSYLADYMMRSKTGFYLMGVRVTQSAVLRLSNSLAVVAVTLLAKVIAQLG